MPLTQTPVPAAGTTVASPATPAAPTSPTAMHGGAALPPENSVAAEGGAGPKQAEVFSGDVGSTAPDTAQTSGPRETASQGSAASALAKEATATGEGDEAAKSAEDADAKLARQRARAEYARQVKREQRLRAKEQQLKAGEDAAQRWSRLQTAIAAGDVDELQKLGLSYSEIIAAGLKKARGAEAAAKPDPERELKELKARLDAKEAAEKKAQEEAAERHRQQQVEQGINNAVSFLEKHLPSQGDRFEAVVATKSFKDVVDLSLAYVNAQGIDVAQLTERQATTIMEMAAEQLEDDLVAQAKALAGLKKIKPAVAAPTPTQDNSSESAKVETKVEKGIHRKVTVKPVQPIAAVRTLGNSGLRRGTTTGATEELSTDPNIRWQQIAKKYFGANGTKH